MSPRVIVCGTTFGQVYLEGVRRAPEFELAGILGRGSARSAHCAARYGVPLYRELGALPDGIDIACVVVRSGLLGGGGVQLAQSLMARGIHVLQEHPLHHDELAACLAAARRAGVAYQLNSFYPHVAPVRRFLAAARALATHSPIRWIDAACGFQLAYSLLDILGRGLGGLRPWELSESSPWRGPDGRPGAFRGLEGIVGGVPVTLRIQNEMDPGDPDNHAHLDHRITVGCEAGNLTLHTTHGPILFSQRPHYPHAPRDPGSEPHFAAVAGAEPPSATAVGEAQAPGFRYIFEALWPPGVRRALLELQTAAEGPPSAMIRRGQHQLSVCRLWQDITAVLGPPELRRMPIAGGLTPEQLQSILAAAPTEDPAPALAMR